MIKLTEILDEYKINKPVTYKYKIGEIVRELYGDEESCKILDRRPNWEAVEKNPVEKKYIFQRIFYLDPDPVEDDNTMNEPWYLIQWLEHNKDATPVWWIEEELQPYNNIDEYKINKPVTYKYKIGEIVREIAGDEEVGEILDRRPNWAAVKANPIEYNYIRPALVFDKEYSEENEPWYLFKVLENDVTLWYTESELQPYSLNESIITNTNNEKKTISIDGYDNVSYKFMPNTNFVELRIDNSPQYRSQHDDALGYYPDSSTFSNIFKEKILNKIVKYLRDNKVKAIIIDDTILMTNVNTINENIDEYKVNTPDRGYKIADWVYKYFTEDPYDYDHEKAEVELGPDEAMAMGILWRNMNIFDKNNVTVGDIERWRNEPGSNLEDSTEDEIIHYLTSLVLIKKAQSLNEYKINKPSESIPTAFTNQIKDAINRHIISNVKEYTDENGNPVVEFIKDEKYGTHDAIIEFIKEHMVVNHYEFEKDGKEIIASPLNASTISDEDVLDYLNSNADLKSYINKVIWKAYFETVDIGDIRNKVLKNISIEASELNSYYNTDNYFDVYVPLVMNKVLDYYIDPIEIFEENDFVQQVNNTLLKSNFINEYKINKPAPKYITPVPNYKGAEYISELGIDSGYRIRPTTYKNFKEIIKNDFNEWIEMYWDQFKDYTDDQILDIIINKFGYITFNTEEEAEDYFEFLDYVESDDEDNASQEEKQQIYNSIDTADNTIWKVWPKPQFLNELNEYKINSPNRNKYISIETDEDGNKYYVIDKGLIHSYLESVIDPEFIDSVETFMDDDEGWEESTLNGLSDFNIENSTGEEIEDFATSEMSFFLTSHPDEFPYKDGLNEYKINKPNSEKYRISWYEGSNQFAQEKIETTLSNAERIAINKLKTQYQYRKSYEYWAVIEQNLGDDMISRFDDTERIMLNPEPDGLYVSIKVYDKDKMGFVITKTIKL